MTRRAATTLPLRLVALLCAFALFAAACGGDDDDAGGDAGDGGDGGTPQETSETRTVDLNALFFQELPDGSVGGGANPVQIRVAPFDGDEFRVGFTEDEVAGTGDQWRAAGWQAATTATIITGGTLTGREVTFDVQGRIDGPSAGGALTVGVLAAFRGDDLDPDVVMTGTINPDGTIGPVGGIPQKVQGAVAVAEGEVEAIGDQGGENGDGGDGNGDDESSLAVEPASLRPGGAPGDDEDGGDEDGGDEDGGESGTSGDVTMLIPAGQGTSLDLGTGEQVDVIDLGRREGVDVREVADIYEAYEEFTGEALPKLEDTGDTDLDEEANERIEAAVTKWLSRYEESGNEAASLGPEGQQFASETGLLAQADEAAASAADLSDQGLQAGAYDAAVEAAAFAAAAVSTGRGWELGAAEWTADLESRAAVCGEVTALVDQLGTFDPETVSDASALIGAYTYAVDAVSLCAIGEDLLVRPTATPEEALQDLLLAGVYFEFNDVLVEAAQDQLEFGRDLGGTSLDQDSELVAVSDFFRRAAEANLNAFDTLIIEAEAENAGVSTDLVKGAFQENFIQYALATSGLNVLASLDEYFGDADTSAYAGLGGALEVYTLSSSLLAQFYSLGAQLDEQLTVVGIDNERALLEALDLGEDQLAGTISQLRDEDVEATGVVGSYEIARLDREGDLEDKFGALASLWAGYVGGRMLSYLGGFETAGLG